LIGEGGRRFPRHGDQTDGTLSTDHRNHETGPIAPESRILDILDRGVRVALDIRQVKEATLANDPRAVEIIGGERLRELHAEPLDALRPNAVRGGDANQVAVHDEDRAAESGTHCDRAAGDRLEDRLGVGRRAPDDAQDLARRRLLIEGLAEFAIARLQLPEQPHILDGDDGLIGEGLHQRDLLVGERPDLAAP